MSILHSVVSAVGVELIRAVSGKLFTEDQVRAVSSHAVGKYFADLLPEPAEDRTARERVEEARSHIGKASSIIAAMQSELSTQTTQLDALLGEIEEKKKMADQYAQLAATSREQFSALRKEMEEVLRQELVAQSEKGKRVRQLASSIIWVLTLVLGAALGTYFKEVLVWIKPFLG